MSKIEIEKNNIKLKKCPFCNGDSKLYFVKSEHPYVYEVQCSNCGATRNTKYSYSEANFACRKWNERAKLTIKDHLQAVKDVYIQGYEKGHHDTVEGGSFCPEESAVDYLSEIEENKNEKIKTTKECVMNGSGHDYGSGDGSGYGDG